MPALRAPLRAPIQWPGRVVYKVRSGALSDTTARVGVGELSVLGVLLLLAMGLRLLNLGHSYWGDEDATIQLLREPFWFMLRHGIPGSESTPPLYYVIASLWSHVFGTSEVAVRSLTALVGVATVAVAYAIGAELRRRRAGLILAGFVAVSPYMVWFSQDARAYGLAVLLTSAGLLFFAQALRTASSKSIWLWALASAFALTAHYFTIFVVVPEAVALLLTRETRSRAVRPTAVVAAVLVFLLPLLLFQRLTGHLSWITFLGLTERLTMTLQFFDTGSWALNILLLAGLTVLIAVIIGCAFVAHRIHRRELVILGVGSSAIVLPILASLVGFDYVEYQNLVVAWIPLAAVLAVALAGWRRVGALLALGLFGFALAATVKVQTTPALQRPDWRLAAKTLSAQPRGLLVIYPAFDIEALKTYDGQVSVVDPGDSGLRPDLSLRVVRTRRVVMLAEDPWVYSAARTLVLRAPAGFHKTSETSFSTFVLVTYSAPHALPVAVDRLASMRPPGYLLATTPWRSAVFFNRHAEAGTSSRLSSVASGAVVRVRSSPGVQGT